MAARLSPIVCTSLLAGALFSGGSAHAGPVDSTQQDETSADSKPVVPGHDRIETGWVWVDPVKDLAPDAVAAAEISHVIYVNRCVGGCTIQPGVNDARANTSSIASSTAVLSEFQWDDAIWDATIACIREVYSPYDVEIVTEDPGPDVFHHEAILAGSPSQLGLNNNVGGIAPAECSPLNNVISFSFANGPSGGDPLDMCWTVAQESAHSFGLPNHVFDCHDPMTYIPGCGKKLFRNKGLPCGEDMVKPCNCSGSTQNSHVELHTVFGDGTPPPPPELSILLPKQDDVVMDGFAVYWDSADPRSIGHSEVWINGTKYRDIPGHDYDDPSVRYQADMPALPDGVMDIEVRSYNELGSEAIATVRATKGAPCSSADTCFDFQECNEGRCEYPPASAALGESCDVTPQCLEGVCATVGSSSACTVTCTVGISGTCSDGFSCKASTDGGFVCWPEGETGGCCTIAASKRDPMPWVGASIFLLGLLLLRRRRA